MDPSIVKVQQNLILSVGIHRKKRILTPVEVGEGIKVLREHGMSTNDIRELLMLENDSMIPKFERLLELTPEIRYLIDWGQTSVTISFSSASEIAKIRDPYDQKMVADAILREKLKKSEVIQILQAKSRSNKSLSLCIDEIIEMRPQIDKKFVFIGAVINTNLFSVLSEKSQLERDQILEGALFEEIPRSIEWAGRLGQDRFTIVGSEDFAAYIQKMTPGYEERINALLLKETGLE